MSLAQCLIHSKNSVNLSLYYPNANSCLKCTTSGRELTKLDVFGREEAVGWPLCPVCEQDSLPHIELPSLLSTPSG